jgi:hypothetical protein
MSNFLILSSLYLYRKICVMGNTVKFGDTVRIFSLSQNVRINPTGF